MNTTEIKELLKDATVFSLLSDDELEQFSTRVELVHYSLGQPICRAGEEPDALYIVYSGRDKGHKTGYRQIGLAWLGQDRIFDPLRAEPRFLALLKKLRL